MTVAADGKAFVSVTINDPSSTPPMSPLVLLLAPTDRGYLVDDILIPIVSTISGG